jgi:hypothetical protein
MFRQEDQDVLLKLYRQALVAGADKFGISKRANKRFYVLYRGKVIHFGSKTGQTFVDHGDVSIKQRWIRRHGVIKNKAGEYVILLKTSPSYWSYILLW